MEVISKQDTNNWEQHHNCENCDSKLKINKQDLIFQKELQGFYDLEAESYYVNCPICSNLSYVQQKDIPKLVQIELKEKSKNFKTSFLKRLFG